MNEWWSLWRFLDLGKKKFNVSQCTSFLSKQFWICLHFAYIQQITFSGIFRCYLFWQNRRWIKRISFGWMENIHAIVKKQYILNKKWNVIEYTIKLGTVYFCMKEISFAKICNCTLKKNRFPRAYLTITKTIPFVLFQIIATFHQRV